MKFWLDENVLPQIGKALEQAWHDTFRSPAGSDDLSVLQQAREAAAVIITHDRDFKRYALKYRQTCAGVIWIQTPPRDRRGALIMKLLHVIETHAETLSTSFIILSLDRIEVISLAESGFSSSPQPDDEPD
jgi:predicted nuclease of predicted toxin-antitoxin system